MFLIEKKHSNNPIYIVQKNEEIILFNGIHLIRHVECL